MSDHPVFRYDEAPILPQPPPIVPTPTPEFQEGAALLVGGEPRNQVYRMVGSYVSCEPTPEPPTALERILAEEDLV